MTADVDARPSLPTDAARAMAVRSASMEPAA